MPISGSTLKVCMALKSKLHSKQPVGSCCQEQGSSKHMQAMKTSAAIEGRAIAAIREAKASSSVFGSLKSREEQSKAERTEQPYKGKRGFINKEAVMRSSKSSPRAEQKQRIEQRQAKSSDRHYAFRRPYAAKAYCRRAGGRAVSSEEGSKESSLRGYKEQHA